MMELDELLSYYQSLGDRIHKGESMTDPKLKSTLRMAMGTHGLAYVVEALVEIAEEFGEGSMGGIDPDPWWLEASAHLSTTLDEIQRISKQV